MLLPWNDAASTSGNKNGISEYCVELGVTTLDLNCASSWVSSSDSNCDRRGIDMDDLWGNFPASWDKGTWYWGSLIFPLGFLGTGDVSAFTGVMHGCKLSYFLHTSSKSLKFAESSSIPSGHKFRGTTCLLGIDSWDSGRLSVVCEISICLETSNPWRTCSACCR